MFAPPRSFSQLTTSFVDSESLGIHHTPLFASFSLRLAFLFALHRSPGLKHLYLSILEYPNTRSRLYYFFPNLSMNFCRFPVWYLRNARSFRYLSTDSSSDTFQNFPKNFQLLKTPEKEVSNIMWRIGESNPWPLECKSSALASWANPPSCVKFSISKRVRR